MTVVLEIPPELLIKAETLASKQGKSIEDLIITLLEASVIDLPPPTISEAERRAYGQARIRVVAQQRGVDWDAMDEEAQEAFIDTLLHE